MSRPCGPRASKVRDGNENRKWGKFVVPRWHVDQIGSSEGLGQARR